ncbi:unnamed protein product [Pleuronectes platessa]|uniref:Uncharacterized protein n=1 Tax=Pleuronectes platessa TaxID=8262 RepID=A0A9N7VZ10_PLEPL|nr:unnamed protein product [Pleuronectes platessa]
MGTDSAEGSKHLTDNAKIHHPDAGNGPEVCSPELIGRADRRCIYNIYNRRSAACDGDVAVMCEVSGVDTPEEGEGMGWRGWDGGDGMAGMGLTLLHARAPVSEICLSSSFLLPR